MIPPGLEPHAPLPPDFTLVLAVTVCAVAVIVTGAQSCTFALGTLLPLLWRCVAWLCGPGHANAHQTKPPGWWRIVFAMSPLFRTLFFRLASTASDCSSCMPPKPFNVIILLAKSVAEAKTAASATHGPLRRSTALTGREVVCMPIGRTELAE